jgi:hypothetical protein
MGRNDTVYPKHILGAIARIDTYLAGITGLLEPCCSLIVRSCAAQDRLSPPSADPPRNDR